MILFSTQEYSIIKNKTYQPSCILLPQDIDYADNANKTYASLMSSRFMEVCNFVFLHLIQIYLQYRRNAWILFSFTASLFMVIGH